MAIAFSTKYPNNIRTVSGTVSVYQDDVVLLCTTSGGAVTINLNEIPAGYWNTLYKLYVFDNSNNAGTNNITVVAPTGFKVNNAQTFVINTNGGGAIIRIGDNTNYLASLNSTGGGSIAVYDEGVLKTASVASFDFTGAGVTATNVGNAVTVNVPNIVGGLVATIGLTGVSLPIAAAGTRRVASGTVFNNTNGFPYSASSEYGSFSGTFNTTTGEWTCPATGYYDITIFLALILNGTPNENAILPNYFQGNGTGSANIEAIGAVPHNLDFDEYIGSYGICATDNSGGTIYCQQQVPVYFNNSCLNISGTYTGRLITSGTILHCRFLNKTQYGGALVSGSSFHFTVKRVY